MSKKSLAARWRVTAAIGAVLTATGALSACASSGGGDTAQAGGDPTHVTFAVGSPTLTETTAPYAAIPEKLGYWKKQGLDVQVQPTQGAVASMQLLVAGKADIVNGGATAFYQAVEKSPDIRVVSLGVANIWHVFVPAGSDIKSIDDLKGKTIGAQSLSSSSYLFGRATIASAGLDPDKDVQWLPVGVGAQAAQAFKSNQIAAYASYDGPSGVVGNVLGKELAALPSKLDKIPGFLGIATTEKYLKAHRDIVAKFMMGTYEGAVFAAANPAAALQIQWAAHPDQKPRDISTEDAIKQFLPIVDSRYKGGAVPGPDDEIGNLSQEDVQAGIDFLYKYGLIDTQLQADKVADLSVNKAANQFDTDAVKKQAQEWKP